MNRLKNYLIIAGVLLLSVALFVNGFAADVDPKDVEPKLEIERFIGLSLNSNFSKTFTMEDASDFNGSYFNSGNVGSVGVRSTGAEWGLKVKTDTASVKINRNSKGNLEINGGNWQDNIWEIFELKVSNPSGTWPNGKLWGRGGSWIDFSDSGQNKKLAYNWDYGNVDAEFDVGYRFNIDDIESLIETLVENSASKNYMDDALSDITASFPLTFYAIPKGDV